ncbi:LacI family DNA-binding transcriptional regulator [Streptomyces sp. TLI_171]|uniref:LacI family DNA-binding transcriptional regulator n=1 Tax=Streptomyces sp. TLI_171 TaxID=1938859 RepID=UPI000C18959D|nr:LacI family DNA-binding transcriptional regulator [Streptomyces sp. TLI_171]RKE22823.1 LacI family transcriptional regulator [Streptomyces sp. TLI_171]
MGRPKSSRVTVREIAAAAGVSPATVSRVLTGQAVVADETRAAVRDAMDRLGTPEPAAKRTARPGAVFVRCPYLLTDYFGTIVTAVAETLERHGRELILSAGGSTRHNGALAELPRRRDLAGALLILPVEEGEELERLRRQDFPFVVIDPRTPVPRDIAAVSASHFTGARNLTAHLAALGHRRIGIINGPGDWLASTSRFAGHTSALAEVGVLIPPELVASIEPTSDWGYSAAGRLLDLPDRPTALVAFNDKAAVGALRAAHERGLRVPEDVSIAGFDDDYLSRTSIPTLTTVRQPLEELGGLAVSLLLRLIEGTTVEALHVELATELITRNSTGPVPPAAARSRR